MDINDWPNCSTTDCGNKVCLWASLTKCYKCCEKTFGHLFMEQLYTLTHPDSKLRADIEGIDG